MGRAMGSLKASRAMKRTWNRLAQRNAMHFIDSARDEWDPSDFVESGARTLQTIFDSVDYHPQGESALDLGCGLGRMSIALAQKFDKVLGVDVSEEMVGRARILTAEVGCANVEYWCNTGVDLAFVADDSCDLAFSYIVFQHIPIGEIVIGYIAELARVVKPGGTVLFQIPVYKQDRSVDLWKAAQALVRLGLWPLEASGFVAPEHGVAFRGTRLSRKELESALHRSQLEPLAVQYTPSPYRFCDNVIVNCRKNILARRPG